MGAKLLTLCKSNFRTASVALRSVADELEALEAQGVECEVAMVVKGESLEVYGMGAADAGTAHILLACGQRKLENAVLNYFEGD